MMMVHNLLGGQHQPCCMLGQIAVILAIANLTIAQAQPADSPTPTTPPNSSSEKTLAPFAPVPITPAPIIDSPRSISPTSAEVTTPAPVEPTPTVSPTYPPSFVPSFSAAPTFPPSYSPTNYPTFTHMPTSPPTGSTQPTFPPSTSTPTVSPTPFPTLSPLFAPSGSPSTNETSYIKRSCSQMLEVSSPDKFEEVQVGIYQLLMESYTVEFGHMVGEPQISTACEVTGQSLAGGSRWRRWLQDLSHRLLGTGRRLQTNLLIMEFTMEYQSRYGYNVEEYPKQFQTYINNNLEKVTEDMESRFLPVLSANEVIVFNTDQPTSVPTPMGGTVPPSMRPSYASGARPTSTPTFSPTETQTPSVKPTPKAPGSDIVEDQTSFIVGLAAGLGGAALIILLLIWYMRRKNQPTKDDGNVTRESAGGISPHPSARLEEGIEVRAEDTYPVATLGRTSSHDAQYPPEDNGAGLESPGGEGTIQDSIFSNPSMVSGGGSFSSNPEDNYEGVRLETLQDEFDNYKNQDLEYMRSGVEETVYGAEGMMSLAMTRALMDDEDAEVNTSWGGAEDPESIEANCLCETNDWLRKNEHSTLEERNLFFQDLLNRMVITVRRGMITPSDGTRAIHCCATMLGLQLEKELPNNVLLVHGMRKTNDLSLGRQFLVQAFESFGEIEGAAIAPSNKGFGFVRFVSPKSVQRALERFRIAEIEVQDVSVMIKSLKSDAPAM